MRISFENLDPHRGAPVSLAVEDLQRKLVGERRGGYCFEQNLLLKAAAEALGAEVQTMLARVRVGAEPGTVRGPTHLVLRVEHEGESWLADVGFGLGAMAASRGERRDPLSRAEIADVLEREFGLGGFTLDAEDRVAGGLLGRGPARS